MMIWLLCPHGGGALVTPCGHAPYRRIGAEAKAKYGAGGQISTSRGSGEFRLDIDIDHLRRSREDFEERGFVALRKSSATDAPLRSVEEW